MLLDLGIWLGQKVNERWDCTIISDRVSTIGVFFGNQPNVHDCLLQHINLIRRKFLDQ